MTVILGFAGDGGQSGKSSAAYALHEVVRGKKAHIEYSDAVIALADGWMWRWDKTAYLYEAATVSLQAAMAEHYQRSVPDHTMARLPIAALGDYVKQRQDMPPGSRRISAKNEELHRPLLQWLGHEAVKYIDTAFWADAVRVMIEQRQAAEPKLITVSGVRWPHDARMIRMLQGQVIYVERSAENMEQQTTHLAEPLLPREYADVSVYNTGNLEDLQQKMAQIWQDIRSPRATLATEY